MSSSINGALCTPAVPHALMYPNTIAGAGSWIVCWWEAGMVPLFRSSVNTESVISTRNFISCLVRPERVLRFASVHHKWAWAQRRQMCSWAHAVISCLFLMQCLRVFESLKITAAQNAFQPPLSCTALASIKTVDNKILKQPRIFIFSKPAEVSTPSLLLKASLGYLCY